MYRVCVLLLVLGGCCNQPGPDVSEKFRAERRAVEAAMAARARVVDLSDPVHEYRAPSGVCPDDALGCCNTGMCAGIFVPDRDIRLAGGAILLPADVALHEYTHRALLDCGLQPGPEEHPPIFWETLNAARRMREQESSRQVME